MKNTKLITFYIAIAFIIFVASPGTGMARNSSADIEQESIDKANQFVADHNYEQAALVLEAFLAKNPDPDPNVEMIYRQLTHIYDDYLFYFDNALSSYERYLVQFPEGTFGDAFRERIAYLNERRSEWQILSDFRKIQLEGNNIPISESLKNVEAILARNENAVIAPEMQIYLGNKYFETAQYQKAREHVENYINGFDKTEKASEDKAMALKLYSDILVKQHHFGKAIQALDQAIAQGNPEENFDFAWRKSDIIKQRNMSYGLMFSLFYYILLVIGVTLIRFWRHFKLQDYSKRLTMPLFLLALISLVPVLILKITKEPEVNLMFFFDLLGLSVLSHFISRLLAPMSLRTGKWIYGLICCLHMGAASYMTYYLTVYTPVNSGPQVDLDPVNSLFLIFIWSSAAAAILINTGYAFVFSKTIHDRSGSQAMLQ